MDRPATPSLEFERGLRLASLAHQGQVRKGSGTPYIQHPMAVALILDRAGFEEPVVIAGLLHDLVEDTAVTLDRIASEFGDRVAALVEHASEVKLDALGAKRPWIDRKRDQISAIRMASDDAKALVLADKLHNLLSIRLDLLEGRPAWDSFSAGREQVLWYYLAMIGACEGGDPRLASLAAEAEAQLAAVRKLPAEKRDFPGPEG